MITIPATYAGNVKVSVKITGSGMTGGTGLMYTFIPNGNVVPIADMPPRIVTGKQIGRAHV